MTEEVSFNSLDQVSTSRMRQPDSEDFLKKVEKAIVEIRQTYKIEQKAENERPPSPNVVQPAWILLSTAAQQQGFTVTAAATADQNKHNKRSLHPAGFAIDVRTSDKSHQRVNEFIDWARNLGLTVRDERTHPPGQPKWMGPHVHLEFKIPGQRSSAEYLGPYYNQGPTRVKFLNPPQRPFTRLRGGE